MTQPCHTPCPAAAKSLQSCPTLCNPIDGSPAGSPVPGILQARTLEWVAISFSNAWKWKVKVKSFSHVRLFATPWTAAYQAPLPMGFARQEYWSWGARAYQKSDISKLHEKEEVVRKIFQLVKQLVTEPWEQMWTNLGREEHLLGIVKNKYLRTRCELHLGRDRWRAMVNNFMFIILHELRHCKYILNKRMI